MVVKPFAFDSSDRVVTPRCLRCWLFDSKLYCAFGPTPRKRRGHSQGGYWDCRHCFSLCSGSRGSGRKGLLCTWEQNEVQILSAFLQLETMQMFLQIHLRSCRQFWSAALFGKWWYWHLISLHCPAPNGAHCFLQDWVGATLFPPNTASRSQVVLIPCGKWFRLLLHWDHLCVSSSPLDSDSCPYYKENQSSLPALDFAGLRAPFGLTLEAM